MMTVATGRRPPFDNIVVSNFNSRFAPYPAYNMDFAASTSRRTASSSGQCHQAPRTPGSNHLVQHSQEK